MNIQPQSLIVTDLTWCDAERSNLSKPRSNKFIIRALYEIRSSSNSAGARECPRERNWNMCRWNKPYLGPLDRDTPFQYTTQIAFLKPRRFSEEHRFIDVYWTAEYLHQVLCYHHSSKLSSKGLDEEPNFSTVDKLS